MMVDSAARFAPRPPCGNRRSLVRRTPLQRVKIWPASRAPFAIAHRPLGRVDGNRPYIAIARRRVRRAESDDETSAIPRKPCANQIRIVRCVLYAGAARRAPSTQRHPMRRRRLDRQRRLRRPRGPSTQESARELAGEGSLWNDSMPHRRGDDRPIGGPAGGRPGVVGLHAGAGGSASNLPDDVQDLVPAGRLAAADTALRGRVARGRGYSPAALGGAVPPPSTPARRLIALLSSTLTAPGVRPMISAVSATFWPSKMRSRMTSR